MLKAYMVYDRGAGPEEGAALAFAHNYQEARKVGWQALSCDFIGEYIDTAAQLLRNKPWLFEEVNAIKFANDEPHVIDNPLSCSVCEHWGQAPIGPDGICQDCKSDAATSPTPTG